MTARPNPFVPPRALRAACLALGVGSVGCPANEGVDPPADSFFYPVSVAASPSGGWLYVTSSDFDLRYNGGTVAPVDLTCLRARVADPQHARCAALPSAADIRCVVDRDQPGATVCEARAFVRADQVRRISAYAIDSAVARYPDRTRLYVAVRGDGSVTWFDLDDSGGLDCGASGALGRCADNHRVGADAAQSPTAARLPPDPSSISLDPARGWVLITHQSSDVGLARASLIRDGAVAGGGGAPVLLSALGNLSPGLSGAALLPRAAGSDERSTWIVTSRSEASFSFFQAYPGNATLRDASPFLYRSAIIGVRGLAGGNNNRAIALDPDTTRHRAFVVSRAPEALLSVTLDPANPTAATVVDVLPVPRGPSRLVVRSVDGHTQVMVISFDARRVTVIDPDERRVVGQVVTRRGPHQAVLDPSPSQPFLYLVDFLDGALEVIDLRPPADPASPGTYLSRVLTLAPQLPQE
jgi:DNA-binding beta-propeller fold protein YncE